MAVAGVDVIRHGAPLELYPDGKYTKFVICPCPLQISSLRTFLPRHLGVVGIIMQQIQSPHPPPEMAEGHRPCLAYRPRRVESPGKARDAAGARPI